MTLFSPQIPLQLEPTRGQRLDNFVRGANAATVDALVGVLDEAGAVAHLSGPPASGKTHLLNALCVEARGRGLTAFYASLRRMPSGAGASLDGLEGMDLVCVDDLHAVAGRADWEEALFHLVNRVLAARGRIVFASRVPLANTQIALPDLASRLAWGLRTRLEPLDEAGKRQVLRAECRTLGMDLPPEVEDYLVRRERRDLRSLLRAVGRLQQAVFSAKRRMTVPLARDILGGAGRD